MSFLSICHKYYVFSTLQNQVYIIKQKDSREDEN